MGIDLETAIREAVYTTIVADATFRTLTGWTATDPRLYWYFQGDAELSGSKRAYITYTLLNTPEPQAVSQPIYSFRIWAREEDLDQMLLVRDRLKALFHQKLLSVSSQPVYGKCVMEGDAFQPEQRFAGLNIQFRFGYSTV
jgi:hypothetical protein